MALNQTRLKNALKAAYQDAETNGGDTRADQLEYFCDKLAGVLIDEIKQLQIVYSTGLTSATGGPVSGTLNHTVQ